MTVSEERNTPHPEDRLVDLLYPEGQDAARLAALRAEVAADPALSEKLRQYETVRSLVADLPVPEPERAVHYELLRQARAAAEASGTPRTGLWAWLSTLQLGPVLAGALGLMLAVGGTMMLTHESADFAPPPAPAASSVAVTEAPQLSKAEAQAETKTAADSWAAPASAVAQAAPVAPPASAAPDPSGAAESLGRLAAATAPTGPTSLREAAKRPGGTKGGLGLDDAFGDAGGEGQGYGIGGVGSGRGGGGRADANTANAFPAEQARRAPVEEMLAEGKASADAPKARVFAEPPPPAPADTLAQEADDGIVHGVAPEQVAPAPAPAPQRRAAEAKPASVAVAKSAPGGGYAADDMDEAIRDDRTSSSAGPRREVATGGAAAAAPAPPPEAPAEPVASNERSADKDSAPMAKKAKADDSARTNPLELARMARKVNQWREAARRYEEFIDRFPNHAELPAALFETAETYERLGETARAIELYRLVARNGGGLGDRAQDRISELEGKRRKQAPPAKPSPQAAPAKDFESEVPPAAERK